MKKRTVLPVILLCLLFSKQPFADSTACAGAGSQYLPADASFVPEMWIKGTGDLYKKISEEFTLFGEGELFAVYTPSTALLDSVLELAADLSYLSGAWLLRWGIRSGLAYTTGDTLPGVELGSDLLLAFGSDQFTVRWLPQITYSPEDRVLLDLPVQLGVVFTLFEQLILAPEITGGWAWIREGSGEPYYSIACTLDWYPGAPFTLNWVTGYSERFSANEYEVNAELTIPAYYGYREIYGSLATDWILSNEFTLQLQCPFSYKLMKHNAVLLPVMSTEAEWQFTLKPEVKLEYAFTGYFSLLLNCSLTEVWSNTPYVEIGYLQAGLEAVLTY